MIKACSDLLTCGRERSRGSSCSVTPCSAYIHVHSTQAPMFGPTPGICKVRGSSSFRPHPLTQMLYTWSLNRAEANVSSSDRKNCHNTHHSLALTAWLLTAQLCAKACMLHIFSWPHGHTIAMFSGFYFSITCFPKETF